MAFKVGQRWTSHTEPNLGLGLIAQIEERQIVLSYPAACETRAYTKNNPPLSRIIYRTGDRLINAEGVEFVIEKIEEKEELITYLGKTDNGETMPFPEWQLSSDVQFNTPIERLISGQVDNNKDYELRVKTIKNLEYIQKIQLTGLLGTRTELIPHQVYITYEVANRIAPRVLLSDEVGLGKTIEAGMILHHQILTGRVKRALIILPDSLVHQWFVEMLRRFNLHFAIFDEERFNLIKEDEDNPFESEQLIITTLSFLVEKEEALSDLIETEWDLTIIDEAHHIHWQPDIPSREYQAVDLISRHSEGLLLLTATPEQVGIESHFARLKLLDPYRYDSLDQYQKQYLEYRELNQVIRELMTNEVIAELDSRNIDLLRKMLDQEWAEDLLDNKSKLINMVLDRYGTGRSVFRNQRDVMDNFPSREVYFYPISVPKFYQDLTGFESLFPETVKKPNEWIQEDTRITWLEEMIKSLKHHKVLVICHNTETAQQLDKYFNLYAGIRSTAFFEGLSLVERDRAAAYFAEEESGAKVLICSEVGSEGRNFQFAHHLVLFDLPTNPDLIEQRIGRLDRIGQKNNISIHIPYFQGTAQEVMQRWYHEGLNQFYQSCSAGYAIYETFSESLMPLIERFDSDGLDSLVIQTKQHTEKVSKELKEGKNALLAINSCDSAIANTLIQQIREVEESPLLLDYVELLFDRFGLDYEEHSTDSFILRPTDHMRTDHFPGLNDDPVTVTFNRERALQREDIEFLTWEHPIVTGAMEMVLGSELGNTTLSTIKIKGLPAGTLMLETWFTLETIADKNLQIERFLKVQPIRYLVGAADKDLSTLVPHDKLNQLCQHVKRRVAQAIINETREPVNTMVKFATQLAEQQLPQRVVQAQEKLKETRSIEIERLKYLKKINANIRESEVTQLEAMFDQSALAIGRAKMVLQAVKVIVTSEA